MVRGTMVATAARRWTLGLGAGLVDAVYPARCAGCGRRGCWVCADCRAMVPPFVPPWCARCGIPDERACRCAELSPDLARLRSVAPFDGWLRRSVIAFKYDDETARAACLGDLLGDILGDFGVLDGLVPVPLHPRRLRARGYNQAVLLCDRAGASLGIPVREVLTRERETQAQVGLGADERRANVAGAFSLAPGAVVTGLRLALVDDVCTTGSTLGACAAVLTGAGAAEVVAATLAREV